jgi:hypothetical protein
LHLTQRELTGSRFRDDDEIDIRRKHARREAETLAAEPFDAVSHDCDADFLGGDDANTRRSVFLTSFHDQDEVGRSDALSTALNTCEVDSLANAPVATEREHGNLLLVDRHGEALTPLATTIREHFAATARLHTGTKPVGAQATDVVGLIRAFHGRTARN